MPGSPTSASGGSTSGTFGPDLRFAVGFAGAWLLLVLGSFFYMAFREERTILDTIAANQPDATVYALAGVVASFLPFLFSLTVTMDSEGISVRGWWARLTGRTVRLPFDQIVSVEERYAVLARSRILHITTTDGRVVKINHHPLRRGTELRGLLLAHGRALSDGSD